MPIFKKYALFESCISHDAGQDTIELWKAEIKEFMLTYIQNNPATLICINPSNSNIGYDIGKCIKGSVGSEKYLVSHIDNLNSKIASELLDDSDFYLGFSLLAKGTLALSKCEELLISWDDYLLSTGQDFFRMGADGHFFYWYNPSEPDIYFTK